MRTHVSHKPGEGAGCGVGGTHLQQRVFQLDVAVGHTAFMAVVQPQDQLLEEPAGHSLTQAAQPLGGGLDGEGAVRSGQLACEL